jgi:hypothetical protein
MAEKLSKYRSFHHCCHLRPLDCFFLEKKMLSSSNCSIEDRNSQNSAIGDPTGRCARGNLPSTPTPCPHRTHCLFLVVLSLPKLN